MLMLYTRPGCGPCAGLKRRLTTMDLPFTEVDITQDPAAAARLKEAGFTTVPVLEDTATGQMWPGVDTGQLRAAKKRHDLVQAQAPYFELGQIEPGEPLSWTPASGSLLVVGDRDSGKATVLGRLLQATTAAGWQAWALGAGTSGFEADGQHLEVLTADVADQLERVARAYELMEQRYQLLEQAQLAQEAPAPVQQIVLVIDDYEDLHQRWADLGADGYPGAERAEAALISIARLGRTVNLHLAVACRGIGHHLGQTMTAAAEQAGLVHLSFLRSPLTTGAAHVA